MSSVGNTNPSFEVSQLNKYIKYINFVIVYIVTFTLVCIPKYEIVGMGLLLSFNFIIHSFLLYDIFSLNDTKNSLFTFVIVFGIALTFLSSVYVLKMLVQVQNKHREVGHVTQRIDKNTNQKYHLFSNLFITNVGLIILNAIVYFIYKFSGNINYSNNYLYNELNYEDINYSFFENVYYSAIELGNTWFGSISVILYPFIFLFVLFYNTGLTIAINVLKTLQGLYNKFLHTILFLFKSASLIAIIVLSSINLVLSTTMARIRFKRNAEYEKNVSNANKIDSSKTNSIFTQISSAFTNLNMNYLMNYKIVT
jgi:hypothetical protein